MFLVQTWRPRNFPKTTHEKRFGTLRAFIAIHFQTSQLLLPSATAADSKHCGGNRVMNAIDISNVGGPTVRKFVVDGETLSIARARLRTTPKTATMRVFLAMWLLKKDAWLHEDVIEILWHRCSKKNCKTNEKLSIGHV